MGYALAIGYLLLGCMFTAGFDKFSGPGKVACIVAFPFHWFVYELSKGFYEED